MPGGRSTDPDAPFWRRHQEGLVYLGAAVTYIAACLVWKGLLNWIVGPAWVIAWVWLVSPQLDRWWARRVTRQPR
ncbi:MAG: hypothetical protein ACRD0U_06935 [Acidimicrobiales bacterium]